METYTRSPISCVEIPLLEKWCLMVVLRYNKEFKVNRIGLGIQENVNNGTLH